MAAKLFTLDALPAAPGGRCPQIRRSRQYLEATYRSVSGLLDSFNVVREKTAATRGTAEGRLNPHEVDLLRAALIFTSSGLDACCHTLVRECLPDLIDRGGTAKTRFDLFLDGQARLPSAHFIAALKDSEPRTQLIALYLDEKTRASYQGTSDIKDRVRDLLGIPNDAVPTTKINNLDGFFTARNDIVHRLDYVDPNNTSTRRHHRAPKVVVAECNQVLALVSKLIQGTADIL